MFFAIVLVPVKRCQWVRKMLLLVVANQKVPHSLDHTQSIPMQEQLGGDQPSTGQAASGSQEEPEL